MIDFVPSQNNMFLSWYICGMENKLYTQDQLNSAIKNTQKAFISYFEKQEEIKLREFSFWIDSMENGHLLLNQGLFKTLPDGIKKFFLEQLNQA